MRRGRRRGGGAEDRKAIREGWRESGIGKGIGKLRQNRER